MPCTPDAADVLRKANVLIAPSMAAGTGGFVAGEYELKETNVNWSTEDFESKLQGAMKQTYQRALKTATDFGYLKESPELAVGTWNVGGNSPDEDLNMNNWLITGSPADIYVLGFQEIVPLNAGNVLGVEDSGPTVKWLSIIRQYLKTLVFRIIS